MKKILIFTFLILVGLQNYAQNVGKPQNIYAKTLGLLQKVEQTDKATILYFEKQVVEPGKAFVLPENLGLRNQMNNHFYQFIKVENTPNDEILSKINEKYEYQLFFQPIDKKSTSIQLITRKNVAVSENSFGEVSDFFYINPSESQKKRKEVSIFSDISIEKALLRAEKEHKKVLIYFKERNNSISEWLEREVFSDEIIQQEIRENYIAVVVNLNTHRGLKRFRKYKTEAIPALVKVNSKGEKVSESSCFLNQEDILTFLQKTDTQTLEKNSETFSLTATPSTQMEKRQGIGFSVGINNSQISNLSSKIRTAVSTDLLYTLDYDQKYLLRTGLRFAPKGSCDVSVNYLQIPLELGWTAYETNLFDLETRVRLLASPYYALRLSGKSTGVSTTDYGFNFGIAPEIGTTSKLSVCFYYEYGGKDIFKEISGFQRNQSFGINATLTF